jgi:DNA-binding SARP family transcriptional activator
VSRSELTELFWPGLEEAAARNNLCQLLHRARKLEWETELEAEGVHWRAETDLRRFRQALRESDWAEAVKLYRGDFLEGVRIYDLSDLENWLEAEREDLQVAWHEAVLHYAALLKHEDDLLKALRLERYQRTARLTGDLYGLSAALGLEEPPGNPSLLANQIEKARQALGDEAYALGDTS